MKKKNSFWLIALLALLLSLLPQMVFAGEQGAVAWKYWDGNKNWHYETADSVVFNMSLLNENGEHYLGQNTASGFVPAKNISAVKMTVIKDGKTVDQQQVKQNEVAVIGEGINGLDYGIGYTYDEDTGIIEEFDGTFWFELANDSHLYYTELAGNYQVKVEWTADSKDYSATLTYSLRACKALSAIEEYSLDDDGIMNGIWGSTEYVGNSSASFEYNELEAYSGSWYDYRTNKQRSGNVKKTYVYTDSTVDGIFSFKSCSSGFENIFKKGDSIKVGSEAEIVPLSVYPANITEDMIGKSCELTFTNGKQQRVVTIKITKADTGSYMKEGAVYAIAMYEDRSVSVAEDGTAKICIGDNNRIDRWNYNNWMDSQADITIGSQMKYSFVRYQAGKLHAVSLNEISDADKELLGLTSMGGSEGKDIYEYQLEGKKLGSVYLIDKNSGNKILCRIQLPDTAVFSAPERTEDTYMAGGELHYVTADKSADGGEAYFYVISRIWNTQEIIDQEDLKVRFVDNINENGEWKEKYYDEEEIKFTPAGFYHDEEENEDFYVWKMTVTDEFRISSEYGDSDWKNIRIFGGAVDSDGYYEYSGWTNVEIYDATEILSDQQLYWFDYWEVKVEGGQIVLNEDRTSQTLDELAGDLVNGWDTSGNTEGYFAVKKDGKYYAVNSEVSGDSPENLFVSKINDYKYYVDWRHSGSYLLSANFEGNTYYIKMKARIDDTGFYNKNDPDERWAMDSSNFYFNDAYEKSSDGTKAYFYLISNAGDVDGNCTPVFYKYNDEESKYIRTDSIDGISFGDVKRLNIEDETYYSWQIIVSNSYQTTDGLYIKLEKDGEIISSKWVRIYDKERSATKYGDINEDDDVDVLDAIYLKRYIAGWYGYNRNSIEKRVADLNRDGLIDTADIMILERHIAGWSGYEKLPVVKNAGE